jgi:hypothetical protein
VTSLIGRLAVIALIGASAQVQAASQRIVRGLDHIPVAVGDLEHAVADFEALGFSLKPGRPHANGLRNAHVKFPDGTEIELITSPAATDSLSSAYRRWLEGGDGPAFLGLYAPDLGPLLERLSQLGIQLDRKGGLATIVEPAALRRLFFAGRQRSPTDRPQHFAHANSAFSLAGVWMAGAEEEQRLLQSLGAAPIEERRCGPLGSGTVLAMGDGELVFLPVSARLKPDRSIVGATVAVRSLEAVRRVLNNKRIAHGHVTECASLSVWVVPAAAHGMWLEFRESAR